MEPIFCILVGLFFAASIYLMLSEHLVRILLGISIFGNGVNLLIFTAGRLTGPQPPVLQASDAAKGSAENVALAAEPLTPIGPMAVSNNGSASVVEHAGELFNNTANPLPQALILTAIVIAFSIFAFLLVLAFRAYQALETDNIDDMRIAEGDPARPPLGY